MFKNNFPAYLQTDSKTKIFYTTNFNTNQFDDSKPLLVFNYGLVCSNFHWMYQLPFFEDKGYQILIHDYRCHYNSESLDGIEKCTFENISNDLNKIINFINPRVVHLVGHSMGVNVTLDYARRFPDRVSTMTVISGTIVPPQDIMFDSNLVDIASPYITDLAELFPKVTDDIWQSSYKNPIVRRAVLQGGFNTKKTSDEFVQIYMKKISELSIDLFFHLLQQMKEHDVINYLEDIEIPTLIIGGDKDKIIPNYLQKILNRYILNSELYIVKDGSHVPQVDFPSTINERIERFIT